MSERFNRGDHVDVAAFAAAISIATARVNNFGARIAALSNVSIAAALQIGNLYSTAAQMIAPGQLLATYSQCASVAPSQTASKTWTNLEAADQVFVISTAVFAGAKLWAEAAKWLRKTDVSLVISGGAAVNPIPASTVQAVLASEALVAVADTVGDLVAAAAALVAGFSLSTLGATGVLLGGAAYPVWRNWGAITRAIRNLGASISHEAIKRLGDLAPTVLDGAEGDADEDSLPAVDRSFRRSRSSRLRSGAPSMIDHVGANLIPIQPLLSLPSWYASVPHRSLSGRAFGGAAAAMLTAPLLTAPSFAAISSAQAGIAPAGGTSVVINSTPTIVINSCQPDDIEQRVLEALRQHREAIYEQWCGELKRRQRREF